MNLDDDDGLARSSLQFFRKIPRTISGKLMRKYRETAHVDALYLVNIQFLIVLFVLLTYI